MNYTWDLAFNPISQLCYSMDGLAEEYVHMKFEADIHTTRKDDEKEEEREGNPIILYCLAALTAILGPENVM